MGAVHKTVRLRGYTTDMAADGQEDGVIYVTSTASFSIKTNSLWAQIRKDSNLYFKFMETIETYPFEEITVSIVAVYDGGALKKLNVVGFTSPDGYFSASTTQPIRRKIASTTAKDYDCISSFGIF